MTASGFMMAFVKSEIAQAQAVEFTVVAVLVTLIGMLMFGLTAFLPTDKNGSFTVPGESAED